MSDPVVIHAPIDSVLVAEDRANVQRRGAIDLGAGVTRVRIDDVAPVLADKTLRARASGGVSVGETRVVRRSIATEPEERHAALVKELEARVRESELGAANVKRLQNAITLLQEAQRRVFEELAEDAARGTLGDAATIQRAAAAFEERERAAYAEVLVASRAYRDLEQTITRLRARLAESGHTSVRIVASLEITLSAPSACKCDLVIEYLVPGACWRPEHTATLAKSDALSITTDACVWQNTGEDWTSVALEFSTERPSLGQKPPSLDDDELFAHRRSEVVRVEQRDEVIQNVGLGGGAGASAARVPGIDDGGEVRVLKGKARATVPSDGRPYRVPALAMETKTASSRVSFPELAAAVIVRAVQTNGGATPLLAGPVDLVRDSGFVGRTKLPFIAPGERFELGFGPDPHVRVRREVESVDEEAGLLPSSWIGRSHRIRVHVSNLDTHARKIEITERIPVSEIEKVEIHFDEKKTSPKAKPDDAGFVKWNVELAARGHTTLELRYVLRHHKDVAGI